MKCRLLVSKQLSNRRFVLGGLAAGKMRRSDREQR